jgi:hypothetical protein
MLIQAINHSQEVEVTIRRRCNWIKLRTIPKVGYNFKYCCGSVFEARTRDLISTRSIVAFPQQQATHLLSEFRASNSCHDLVFALARKRHLTLSWVKHIIIQSYGTGPCQFLPPPLPTALLELAVPFSPSCCCCALLKTSCSLATSFDRNAISLTSCTGFCSNHSSVWSLVQVLGRGCRVEQSCAPCNFIHILKVFWAEERSLRKERQRLTLYHSLTKIEVVRCHDSSNRCVIGTESPSRFLSQCRLVCSHSSSLHLQAASLHIQVS